MTGEPLVDHYKPERGLIEVFTNLSGSYRSIEDVATRINISMAKVCFHSTYVLPILTLSTHMHSDRGLLYLVCVCVGLSILRVFNSCVLFVVRRYVHFLLRQFVRLVF